MYPAQPQPRPQSSQHHHHLTYPHHPPSSSYPQQHHHHPYQQQQQQQQTHLWQQPHSYRQQHQQSQPKQSQPMQLDPSSQHPSSPQPPPPVPQQSSQPQPQPHQPPPPPHHQHQHIHYPHTLNLVDQQPRPVTTPHPPYMYALHHQVVAPVAHVPIGAAHYAHLPPSIWTPAHTQYHHPQTHPPHPHQSSLQPVAQPLHVQLHPSHHHPASHLQHVQPQTHPSPAPPPPLPHMYSHSVSQSPVSHHVVHAHTIHSPHQIRYQYPHVHQPQPPAELSHHVVKEHPLPPPHIPPVDSRRHPNTARPNPTLPDPVDPLTKQDDALAAANHPAAAHQDPDNTPSISTKDEKSQSIDTRELSSSPHHLPNGTIAASKLTSPHKVQKAQNAGSPIKDRHSDGSDAGQDKKQSASQRQRAQQATGQPMRKPRKPYTITKTREVWTKEEHNRFLHALQLYDRDWKKIEAYIGTKTVLQIRSHAQKHFGKVAKYNTGEYIPPPRPKKRATMPYPRSRSSTASKSGSGSGGSGSDSGAATENGTASRNGSVNGSITNGNSCETQPGLSRARRLDDNSRTAHSPRRNHDRRQLGEADPMHAGKKDLTLNSQNAYYQTPTGSEEPQKALPRIQGLSSNNLDHRLRHHPPWESGGLQSENAHHNMHMVSSRAIENSVDQSGSDNIAEKSSQRQISVDALTSNESHRPIPSQDVVRSNGNSADGMARSVENAVPNQKDGINQNHLRHRQGSDRVSGPNNSLLVLSSCVDMMQQDTPLERPPAAGWATAAAARRAHRAKVIRARKPPLPLPRTQSQSESGAAGRSDGTRAVSNGTDCHETAPQCINSTGVSERAKSNEEAPGESSGSPQPCPNLPDERGRSPPTSAQEEASRSVSQDPQRSSAGSASISDDAIAGFSCSDRPSVSDMGGSSGGSGSGGSLANSDAGEEDPKSSNDGSGDDANGQSPSTRDSSPADPASSGSRENTPNANSTDTDGNDTTEPQSRENPAPSNDKDMLKAPNVSEATPTVATGPEGGNEIQSSDGKQSGKKSVEIDGDKSHDFMYREPNVMKESQPKTVAHPSSSPNRGPQAISSLCHSSPQELREVPPNMAQESKKRPRSFLNDGPGREAVTEKADGVMMESAKRKRPSSDVTVKSLLNDPEDLRNEELNRTRAPSNS